MRGEEWTLKQVQGDERLGNVGVKAWPMVMLFLAILIGFGWIMLDVGMFMHGD